MQTFPRWSLMLAGILAVATSAGNLLAVQGLPPPLPGMKQAPPIPPDLKPLPNPQKDNPFADDAIPVPAPEDDEEGAPENLIPQTFDVPQEMRKPESKDLPPLDPPTDPVAEPFVAGPNDVVFYDDSEQTYLFPQYWPIKLRGWIDGGYMGNTQPPASRFNGPYNAVDRNEVMGNQAYLIAEANLPADGSFGIGARADVLYGEDYFLVQSIGMELRDDGRPRWNNNEFYGLALPQLYGQVGTNNLNLKVGHFYSITGYEKTQAPDNFFYSKSYSYQFSQPFTHWGGLATWNPTERVEIQGGVTNGWDALDRNTDKLGYLAGIKYTHDSFWVSLTATTGEELNNPAGRRGLAPAYTNRTRYSAIAGLQLTEKLEWILHHWYGFQQNGVPGGGNADWWGIDQYIYYTFNSQWKAGARLEWFYDQDATRIGINRPSNPNNGPYGGSVYSASLGVNWTPHPNVVLRPEIRSDWFDRNFGRRPFDDGGKSQQLLLGLDGIVKF